MFSLFSSTSSFCGSVISTTFADNDEVLSFIILITSITWSLANRKETNTIAIIATTPERIHFINQLFWALDSCVLIRCANFSFWINLFFSSCSLAFESENGLSKIAGWSKSAELSVLLCTSSPFVELFISFSKLHRKTLFESCCVGVSSGCKLGCSLLKEFCVTFVLVFSDETSNDSWTIVFSAEVSLMFSSGKELRGFSRLFSTEFSGVPSFTADSNSFCKISGWAFSCVDEFESGVKDSEKSKLKSFHVLETLVSPEFSGVSIVFSKSAMVLIISN